jgi:hypothetical protein
MSKLALGLDREGVYEALDVEIPSRRRTEAVSRKNGRAQNGSAAYLSWDYGGNLPLMIVREGRLKDNYPAGHSRRTRIFEFPPIDFHRTSCCAKAPIRC